MVLGAAGGLGSAIVQLCVAQGARVIASSVGPRRWHSAGNWVPSPSTIPPVTSSPRSARLTDGGGVDAIIDPVQGEMGAAARSLLAPDGRHVLCGHAGGLVPHDPHFYMYNHTLVGATLGSYPRPEMQRIHAETQAAITRLLDDGRYTPTVTRCVDFDQVPAALAALAARRTTGRVAVRLAPG